MKNTPRQLFALRAPGLENCCDLVLTEAACARATLAEAQGHLHGAQAAFRHCCDACDAQDACDACNRNDAHALRVHIAMQLAVCVASLKHISRVCTKAIGRNAFSTASTHGSGGANSFTGAPQKPIFFSKPGDFYMKTQRLIVTLVAALAFGAMGTAAYAESNDDMSFSGMFKADRIDKNKDGMVSKAEFLDMMSKMWDMKAKEMKVKGDKFNMEYYQQVLMYMKAGG